jgi:hypothetical protein
MDRSSDPAIAVHIDDSNCPVLAGQSLGRIGNLTLGHHPHGERVADVHHRVAAGVPFGDPRRVVTACDEGNRQEDDDAADPRASIAGSRDPSVIERVE